jgi:hypothetical protein
VGHITDFTAGQDTIDLRGLLSASGYTGSNAIADGYLKIVDDAAGAQIWSNLGPVNGSGWWEVTVLDGVSAGALHLQGGVISGVSAVAVAPPGAPAALGLSSIANGFVNAAHDGAGQALTGTAQAGASVTVYDGALAIGSPVTADANGAWSVTLGVLADGAHSLTAIASGAGGSSPSSAPLAFTVDTQAPAAPTGLADKSVVNGYVSQVADSASQTLTGTAEAGATVTVSDGAVALGTTMADATGKWTYVLGALADGGHSLTASAADAAGNAGPASAALSFVVDTVAPIPAVSDIVQSGGYAVISGRAEAGSLVSVFDNGRALGSATANASGSWSLNASLTGAGVHSLTETAMDAAGNAGSSQGAALYSTKSNQTLTGGSGADVLVGNGGDTLTGGAGADHFVFNAAFGKEAVNDFTPGSDQVWIAGSLLPDFSHLMAAAKPSGTDVVVTIDKSDVLTLHHTSLSALHASDFLFF